VTAPASSSRPQDQAREVAAPALVRQILVPDAGVGVKWFVPEPDAADAARLLDARFELHTPSYFFTEAASVLQRKVAIDRTLSEPEGLEAFQFLRTVPLTIHPTEGLLEDAFRHGVRYRRPVYDSLYMVLAGGARRSGRDCRPQAL
jgi:predicted nucleic acid-binding protein